ncbi:ribonuclease 3-like protein 2 [Prunus dulcis]|uniref:ribonuclease 3-like protein 2 n=1 Tax=Prunus dulcis TaxID=3755 RepID=UPI0014837796|nr:ribonuclease 3-like protein 2 [Prunus dulcis]
MTKVFTTPTSLDRVRSPEMKDSVTAVEKILGYNFKNKKLLEEALTHPSYGSPSYKRLGLATLGDSALGHAVTNHFFCMADHPQFSEGQLTLLRSANVSNHKLACVAVHCGLYRYLRHNEPAFDDKIEEFIEALINGEEYVGFVEADEPKVLADIVESVAAAVYIELNFDLDKLWMKFKPLLEPIYTLENLRGHPMTILKEFCEKRGKRLDVLLRDETGNISTADVYVDGQLNGSGSAKRKSTAQCTAAQQAIQKLSQSMVVNNEGTAAGNGNSFRIEEAMQELNVRFEKKRLPKPDYKEEKKSGPPHSPKFVYSVKGVISDGTVKSVKGDEKSRIQYAKNSAAHKMILTLQEYDNVIKTKESDCVMA